MVLSNELIDEFASVLHGDGEAKKDTTCYGTAKMDNGDYVQLDGADMLTPATYTVAAKTGDRVLIMLKGRKAIVIGNITHPVLIVGTLQANDAIIVNGYLTTNPERTTYDDLSHTGVTFSDGGIGGNGGDGAFWTMSNSGVLTATKAIINGTITAESGYLGKASKGFHIDEYGIYSGSTKRSLVDGAIALANDNFTRAINGTPYTNLRFAIGSKFAVGDDGTLHAVNGDFTGTITAKSGYLGNGEKGFRIDEYGIYSGSAKTSLVNGAIALSNDNFTRTINGTAYKNLRFAVGSKFAVGEDGTVHAAAGEFTGKITAESGFIGKNGNGFTINSGAIYSGTHSAIDTNANGIYLGTNGISGGPGGVWQLRNDGTFQLGGPDGIKFANNKVTMGADVSITWDRIPDAPSKEGIITTTNYRTSVDWKTYIDGLGIRAYTITGVWLEGKYLRGCEIYGGDSETGVYPFRVTAAGEMTARYGKIAGWIIDQDKLYKEVSNNGKDYTVWLYAADNVVGVTPAMVVKSKDSSATDWEVMFQIRYNGYIYAKTGNIAGWEIYRDMFTKTISSGGYDYQVWMHADDGITGTSSAFAVRSKASSETNWSTKFLVRYDGYLEATNANIQGVIKADTGYIGGTNGWVVKAGAIHTANYTTYTSNYGNGIYIGVDGFSCGQGGKFYVGQDGVPYCNGSVLHINNPTIATGTSGAAHIDFDLNGHTSMQIGVGVTSAGRRSNFINSLYEDLLLEASSGNLDLASSGSINLTSTLGRVTVSAPSGLYINEKLAVTEDKLPNFKTVTYTVDDQAIAADNAAATGNSYLHISTAMNTPTGYTFLAFKDVQIGSATNGGARHTKCAIYAMSTSGTNFIVYVRNSSTEAAKIKVTFTAIFVKNAIFS